MILALKFFYTSNYSLVVDCEGIIRLHSEEYSINHLCFCSKMVNIFIWSLQLVYNLTNNNLGTQSLDVFCFSAHVSDVIPIKFSQAGDEFYPACINKFQCLSKLSTESVSMVDTECEGEAGSINTLNMRGSCDLYYNECCISVQLLCYGHLYMSNVSSMIAYYIKILIINRKASNNKLIYALFYVIYFNITVMMYAAVCYGLHVARCDFCIQCTVFQCIIAQGQYICQYTLAACTKQKCTCMVGVGQTDLFI